MTSRNQINRLRAASVVIALLLGWLCAPVLLTAQTLDVCSMQCCVKQKQCCCTPHHSSVKEEPADGKAKLDLDRMESRCPEGCLSPKVINSFSLRDLACASTRAGSFDGLTDLEFHCADFPLEHHVLSQSSPRAPPISLQDQIA